MAGFNWLADLGSDLATKMAGLLGVDPDNAPVKRGRRGKRKTIAPAVVARSSAPTKMELLEARRLLTSSVYISAVNQVMYEDGSSDFIATISRDGDSGSPLSVGLSITGTGDHPASSADYSAISGSSLTSADFAAGEDSVTLTLGAVQDTIAEGTETFNVALQSGSGYELTTITSVAGMIIDDGDYARYKVSIADNGGVMDEADGTLQFGISRTLGEAYTMSGEYAILVHVKTSGIDDGIHNSADEVDYEVLPNEETDGLITSLGGGDYLVTFESGRNTVTLNIAAVDDTEVEPEEWFKVVLLDGSPVDPNLPNAGVDVDEDHSQAFGGIADDDQVVSIVVNDDLASEDGDVATFIVRRKLSTNFSLDVPIEFEGEAILGVDFNTDLSGGTSPFVHFDAGMSEITFSIIPIADTEDEDIETIEAVIDLPAVGETTSQTAVCADPELRRAIARLKDADIPTVIEMSLADAANGENHVSTNSGGNKLYVGTSDNQVEVVVNATLDPDLDPFPQEVLWAVGTPVQDHPFEPARQWSHLPKSGDNISLTVNHDTSVDNTATIGVGYDADGDGKLSTNEVQKSMKVVIVQLTNLLVQGADAMMRSATNPPDTSLVIGESNAGTAQFNILPVGKPQPIQSMGSFVRWRVSGEGVVGATYADGTSNSGAEGDFSHGMPKVTVSIAASENREFPVSLGFDSDQSGVLDASEVLYVLTVHVGKIRQDSELWWFNGANAASYAEEVTLSAAGFANGTFEWTVNGGSNAVTFVDANGIILGTNAETTTNSIRLRSTGKCAVDAVTIGLAYNGTPVETYKTTVFYPAKGVEMSLMREDTFKETLSGSLKSIETLYWIRVLDQSGRPVKNLEVNESFGNVNSDVLGENWGVGNPNGMTTGSTGGFQDRYGTGFEGHNPSPVRPYHGSASEKVNNAPQYYRAGSVTPGQGMLFRTHKLQTYRGYSRQEEIVDGE